MEDQLEKNFKERLRPETLQELMVLDDEIKSKTQPKEINKLAKKRIALVSPAYHWNPITEWEIPDISFDFPSFLATKNALWALIRENRIPEILKQIAIPVTAFHGAGDIIPCDGTLRFLQDNLRYAKVAKIEEAGHFVWLEPEVKDGFVELLHQELAKG